ncbi:hypothetical protein FK529_04850 [Tsukamurella asaccharolytica]|uniref:Asp23/Gls24 family envelope stress response protein n=1 Tax=Tsukamurella asaccharolytica TaxID=2592067 RepID=A0A5C5RDE1_9ACTN|nr:hypothetical protein [Tsukamurella asaccharolytica]TWS20672.1 hypothetical protein FK529_04850 [Tsukamurella asaccharolytica]
MTTESVPPTASDGQPEATVGRPRAERGRTVIDDRVRRRLIEHAVLAVPGTSKKRALTSRSLPAVQYPDHDQRDLEVQVAADWPVDSAKLVADVRSSIDGELARSLDEPPANTRVHIARVNGERSPDAPFAHVASADTPEALAPPATSAQRRAPRRVAGSVYVAIPLILALLALGGVAIRDTVISLGWAQGSPWLDAVFRTVADLQWEWWTWPAVVLALVIGLFLVITAVKPRRRSHKAVTDELWLAPGLHKARRSEIEVAR